MADDDLETAAAAIRAHLGWRSEVRTSVVERGHVLAYLRSLGVADDDPERVPITFLAALGPESPHRAIPDVDRFGAGWLNGTDEYTLTGRLAVGQRVSAQAVFTDAVRKHGSQGEMLLLTLRTDFLDEHGERIAEHVGVRIRR